MLDIPKFCRKRETLKNEMCFLHIKKNHAASLGKRIVGRMKMRHGTEREDREELGDSYMYFGEVCIATRVRSFGKDISICVRSNGGGSTEIHKIIEGHGDYYFFGFEQAGVITQSVIIDIDKIRRLMFDILWDWKRHNKTKFDQGLKIHSNNYNPRAALYIPIQTAIKNRYAIDYWEYPPFKMLNLN